MTYPQQPQGYYPQPVQIAKNNYATASLVLGIVTLVMAFIPIIGLIAFATGPLSIIFGLMARKGLPVGKGSMVAGLITGGIGLLISIIWAIFFGVVMGTAGVAMNEAEQRMNAVHQVRLEAESAIGTATVNHGLRGDNVTDADVATPWSRDIEAKGSDWVSIAVHAPLGDPMSSVTCRVLVGGKVVDEETSDGIATCRVSLSEIGR